MKISGFKPILKKIVYAFISYWTSFFLNKDVRALYGHCRLLLALHGDRLAHAAVSCAAVNRCKHKKTYLFIFLCSLDFSNLVHAAGESSKNQKEKSSGHMVKEGAPNPETLNRITYDRIDSREYISLTQFRKVAKNTKTDWDPLLLTLKIRHGRKIVKMQVDSKFYISNGEQYPLDFAPVFQKNNLYIPRPLVEELFTDLAIPVSFRFDDKSITVREETKSKKALSGLDFIVIDPGHGGKDPGAFSVNSVMEKKIALEVSTYINSYLKKEFPDIKIYMTRYKDEFLTLEKRSDIANEKLGNQRFGIFISFHCNSTLQNNIRGYEIFYLSQNPGSEEDRKVMMRENDLVASGDPEIGMIESFLLNSQILAESKVLARQLNRTLMTELKGTVVSRGVRKADFRVLRKSLMPAVLVEMGYISNASELKVLQTDSYKKKLAISIANGIRKFIKYTPKM